MESLCLCVRFFDWISEQSGVRTKSHRTATNNGVAVVMNDYAQEFLLHTSAPSSVSSARLTGDRLLSDFQVSYDEQTGKVSFHSLEPHA